VGIIVLTAHNLYISQEHVNNNMFLG